MKNHLYTFAILSLLAFGCKKSDNIADVNEGLKEAFDFKKGSYWVYRDSLSGAFDSFYVNYYTASQEGNANTTRRDIIYTEVITFEIYQKSIPSEHGDTITKVWHYSLKGNQLIIEHFDTDSLSAPRIYGNIFVNYPLANSPGITILPSCTMHGKTYQNVVSISGGNPADYQENLWLVPGIGFVTLDMLHQAKPAYKSAYYHRVLELQRYEIIK